MDFGDALTAQKKQPRYVFVNVSRLVNSWAGVVFEFWLFRQRVLIIVLRQKNHGEPVGD